MTREDNIKKIYDYMGWCRHEWRTHTEWVKSTPVGTCEVCILCNKHRDCETEHPLDEKDMIALKDKMVEKGKWKNFYLSVIAREKVTYSMSLGDAFAWLFSLDLDGTDMPRFFRLFLESEKNRMPEKKIQNKLYHKNQRHYGMRFY